jgi:hypothetical protein
VVNFAQPDGVAIPGADAKRNLPTSPIFDVTALWTWTGELVGACTRKGKTPVMFQSVLAPNGRARNKIYWDKSKLPRWHDDLTVLPQKPGEVGRAYVDAIRREARGLRGPVLEELAAAAKMMAEAVKAGGSVRMFAIAHFTMQEAPAGRLPEWMKPYSPKFKMTDPPEVKAGDVHFELGYYELRAAFVDAVRKAGAKSVVALCHAPVAPLTGPQPDFLIDAQWDYGDAAVMLPGYDIKVFPPSGVLQTMVFWMVTAQTEQELGAK